MNPAENTALSMVDGIRLIRFGDLGAMPRHQLLELQSLLEQCPSIAGFEGCQDAAQRVQAEIDARLHPAQPHGPPDPPPQRRPLPLVRIAFVGSAMAALAWFLLSRSGPESPAATSKFPAVAAEPAPPSESTAAPPAAHAEPQPAPPVPADPAAHSAPPEPAAAADQPPPPPAPPAGEAPPEMLVTGEGANLLPDPDGGFRLTNLNGSSTLQLTGKASRLVIGDINGEVALDLAELDTRRIEFHGTINGNPRILLRSPAGRVEFLHGVGGSATLTIDAPDGEVVFHSGDRGTAPINGGATVAITARSVTLAAGLDGGAKADVTLTAGGSLHHGRLAGGSQLRYRKACPDDPRPAVDGPTDGPGRLIAE
jgi:hypothetical protein